MIVEPVAGNMGVVPPEPGFLEALRSLCDASGALLVFDEVITGFRVARGGAQERFGVTPDLTVLGKIVGGGLPLAAFGGRADVMERLAPAGDVYQAGTLSGNPLATAAGLSVLRRLRDPAVYERLERTGAALETGLAGFGRVQRVGAMLTLFMREGPVRSFDDAQASDTERYGELFRHLLGAGCTSRRRSSRRCSSRPHTATRTWKGPCRRLATSSVDLWDAIAEEASAESVLWAEALRPAAERELEPVFSPLGEERWALGLETIYEGYLLHYGRPRLFAPARPGHRAPARRLPVRPRPRPDRRARRGRRGRRPGGADLALRPAPRGRGRRRRRRLGCQRGAPRLRAAGREARARRARGVRARHGRRRGSRPRALAPPSPRRLDSAPMLALLADAAKEGRDVITGMLIVGLIFLAVIGLGTLSRKLRKH